ncbi:MAG: DUF6787 family protein [Solirubrobacteraceae bacterium]
MYLINKLKQRLQIESNKQFIIVLLTFTLAGLTISQFVKPLLFNFFGLTAETNIFIKIVSWIILIIPLYHVFLLLYGFLLGEFSFFWNFAVQRKIDKFKKRKVI